MFWTLIVANENLKWQTIAIFFTIFSCSPRFNLFYPHNKHSLLALSSSLSHYIFKGLKGRSPHTYHYHSCYQLWFFYSLDVRARSSGDRISTSKDCHPSCRTVYAKLMSSKTFIVDCNVRSFLVDRKALQLVFSSHSYGYSGKKKGKSPVCMRTVYVWASILVPWKQKCTVYVWVLMLVPWKQKQNKGRVKWPAWQMPWSQPHCIIHKRSRQLYRVDNAFFFFCSDFFPFPVQHTAWLRSP